MEEVTMYRSTDGKLYSSEQVCERADKDHLYRQIDAFIRDYFHSGHFPTNYRVVCNLLDNPETAVKLLRPILSALENM